MNQYDDQYIMLAYSLLATTPLSEISRIMSDDEYVYKLVMKETRGQDFRGPFLDCIIQSILDDKRRMEMMHELDRLADYFYSNLDVRRLRNTLKVVLSRYGITFDED